MRLILDTNVIVSALIQRSYPYFILDRILADHSIELCISEPLFSEYVEVLNREQFTRFPDFNFHAKVLLSDLESKASKFQPKIKLKIISDQADNRLLEFAETCKANYIVTGNSKDFTMAVYKSSKIVLPREMFELLNN